MDKLSCGDLVIGSYALQEIVIDLKRAPEKRWRLSDEQRRNARELLTSYKRDLGLDDLVGKSFVASVKDFIDPAYWVEMEALAEAVKVQVDDVVLCNCYYDSLKLVFGCTAFAVKTDSGVLHARNLDWWTENDALVRSTTVNRFIGGAKASSRRLGGLDSQVRTRGSPWVDSL